MNAIEDIKKDMNKGEIDGDALNKYVLVPGINELTIDLSSKAKHDFLFQDKRLFYQRFNLVNNDKQYVMFSNYLYYLFIEEIKKGGFVITDKDCIIETAINVSELSNKTDYDITIIGLKSKGDIDGIK